VAGAAMISTLATILIATVILLVIFADWDSE
jgi:hypothetical protein